VATALLVGPQAQNYVIAQPLAQPFWSDCSPSQLMFNVKLAASITPMTGFSAQMGNDPLTGTSQGTLGLTYRAC
jgi:hypothetical protein